jgi:hypothetical protein
MSDMIFTGRFLGADDAGALFNFYEELGSGVKYPKSADWIREHTGLSFTPLAAVYKGKIVGALWIHARPHHVYLEKVGDFLYLKKSGPYVEVGGMQLHPDFVGKEVNSLLCAMVWARWFAWPNSAERKNCDRSLWARIPGRMSDDGSPMFWKLAGERLTGIPYTDLTDLPFDEQDLCIWDNWRTEAGEKVPVEITASMMEMLGRPTKTGSLIAYQKFFTSWGLGNVGMYAAHSLNVFFRVDATTTKVPAPVQRLLGLTLNYQERGVESTRNLSEVA